MNGRAWHVKKKLDIKKMQNAAKLFLGKHDFTTFDQNPVMQSRQ